MERTKKAQDTTETDGKVWYKKIGGGSLRIGGKIVKPGEKFRATPESIPKGFRDLLIPLEGGSFEEVEKKQAVKLDITKSTYKLVKREKSAWFDVVDANGKVLNEKGMKKEIAEKLISDLSK